MSHTSDAPSSSRNFVRVSLTLASCLIFTSCGNFSATTLAKKSATSISKSVTGLMPSRMPIATVRAGDLKKMPTGADRALAWDRHLNRKRYAYYSPAWVAPKNYKAPTLPDERGMPVDGGLLPPLHPGQGTTLKAGGQLPQ